MSSSLRGGTQEASLQPDPLVPNVLVVPSTVLAARQLQDGEHGYQQLTADMRPQLTDSLPAPSLIPQGRGPAPGGSSGIKHNRTPPWELPSWAEGRGATGRSCSGPGSRSCAGRVAAGAVSAPFPRPSRLLPAPPAGTPRPVGVGPGNTGQPQGDPK